METLNQTEVRVLGCLMEKELATPEYYPLTVNALIAACNQKSNRYPVMNLEDADVVHALDSLRFKQYVVVSSEGGRVPKYRHILAEKIRVSQAELALLCELLIRGPQTLAELRTRAERMHPVGDLASVELALQELGERNPPLVVKLPRQPGRKEQRYAHLLAGEPQPDTVFEDRGVLPEQKSVGEDVRVSQLAEEVASLRQEVAELRSMVEDLKKQFE